MRKLLLVLSAAALWTVPTFAYAYVAFTGADTVVNGDLNGNHVVDLGDTFSITGGTFTVYIRELPADPELRNVDLANYRYNLNGVVSAVNGMDVKYLGSYLVYYTEGPQAPYTVSAGDMNLLASYSVLPLTAILNGTFTETTGPSSPVFADLGSEVAFSGSYEGNAFNNFATGTMQGTMTRTRIGGPIPEPGTFALIGTAVLPLLALRRRT
ncbi:MAG TPA: hypothetical protein VGM37_11640 [Armatimonadota bacterium]|jgi:hypothetical protein